MPNGDVLVVEGNGPGEEPVTTPKQWIAGKVKARSGKAGKGGNRVTLLRRSPGTNTWTQHVYIEGLHSPFGIQLIGVAVVAAGVYNSGLLARPRPDAGAHFDYGPASPELLEAWARAQIERAEAAARAQASRQLKTLNLTPAKAQALLKFMADLGRVEE